MARKPRWVALAALGALGCDDGNPYCGGSSTLPWRTEVEVALFDQDGRPVCNRGTLSARQNWRDWYPLWYTSGAQAELLANGRYALRTGMRCNVYYGVGTETDVPTSCSNRPLQWRVAVDGCEPAEGSWSWEQNIAGGQGDISFHIPIRLRCSRTILPGESALTDASADVSDASRE